MQNMYHIILAIESAQPSTSLIKAQPYYHLWLKSSAHTRRADLQLCAGAADCDTRKLTIQASILCYIIFIFIKRLCTLFPRINTVEKNIQDSLDFVSSAVLGCFCSFLIGICLCAASIDYLPLIQLDSSQSRKLCQPFLH